MRVLGQNPFGRVLKAVRALGQLKKHQRQLVFVVLDGLRQLRLKT